ALVNEAGGELALARQLPEGGLPSVSIARPFIEGEHPGEIAEVAHPRRHGLWQVVPYLAFERRHYVARSERQPRRKRGALAGELDAQIRRAFYQPWMHVHHGCRGHGHADYPA